MKELDLLWLQVCSSPVLKSWDGGPVPHPDFLRPESYSSADRPINEEYQVRDSKMREGFQRLQNVYYLLSYITRGFLEC